MSLRRNPFLYWCVAVVGVVLAFIFGIVFYILLTVAIFVPLCVIYYWVVRERLLDRLGIPYDVHADWVLSRKMRANPLTRKAIRNYDVKVFIVCVILEMFPHIVLAFIFVYLVLSFIRNLLLSS